MNSETNVQDGESWLDHARWVRALAQDVLRDAQRAEDVTQDALVAAWRGGWNERADPTLLRRWLAATARNLARMSVRSESNRRAREAHVAAERSGSTEPIDARIAMKKLAIIAAALLSLNPAKSETDTELANLMDVEPPRIEAERAEAAAPVAAPEPDEPKAAEVATNAEGMGSILVRVISGETEQPLRGVGISIRSSSASQWYDSKSGPSDSRGERRFQSIPKGRAMVTAWRVGVNGENGPGGAVEVLANERAEITIRLGAGETISGRVVDEQGRSVAGAEIWLSAGNGGPRTSLLAGHADAQGRFELHHTGGFQCVGARAPGMKPSLQSVPNIVKPEDPERQTKRVRSGRTGRTRNRRGRDRLTVGHHHGPPWTSGPIGSRHVRRR